MPVTIFLFSKLTQQNSTVSIATSCMESFRGRSRLTVKGVMSYCASQRIATVSRSVTLSSWCKDRQLVLNLLSKWYFILWENLFVPNAWNSCTSSTWFCVGLLLGSYFSAFLEKIPESKNSGNILSDNHQRWNFVSIFFSVLTTSLQKDRVCETILATVYHLYEIEWVISKTLLGGFRQVKDARFVGSHTTTIRERKPPVWRCIDP